MRSRGRFAILAVAALAIGAWGVGSVAADHPVLAAAATPNQAPPPRTAASHNYSAGNALSLAHQQAMRVEFGLRHDPAYIRPVDARVHEPNMILGVPMTAAEVREMQYRDVIGMHLAALGEKLAQAEPATFAGVWLDQAAGGVPVIASTQPADVDRALVASMLPAGVDVQFRTERSSSQYLNALAAKIQNDAQHGDLASFSTLSAGTLPMQNEVRVDLPSDASPADVAAVYARYGPQGLTVDRDAGKLF